MCQSPHTHIAPQTRLIFHVSGVVPTKMYGVFTARPQLSSNKLVGTDMFTVGDAYMFGEQKKWNASGIFRFETHTKKEGVDLTAGDDIVLEWGMGRKLGSKVVLGITGASTWQVTTERGS